MPLMRHRLTVRTPTGESVSADGRSTPTYSEQACWGSIERQGESTEAPLGNPFSATYEAARAIARVPSAVTVSRSSVIDVEHSDECAGTWKVIGVATGRISTQVTCEQVVDT